MEEPNVDELTWMAMDQQHGWEEDEEQIANEPAFDDFLENAPPRPPPPGEVRQQTSAKDICGKRISPDKSTLEEFTTPKEKRRRAPFGKNVLAPETVESSPLLASVPSSKSNEDTVKIQPAEGVTTGSRNTCGVFRMANSVVGDYVTVTAPSGVRVYAERKQSPDSNTQSCYKGRISRTSETKGLLLQSIETMIEVAQNERLQKMFTEDPTSDDPKKDLLGQEVHMHEKLWVEKYAPKTFTELLSEEQTNREVLRWVKQWDSIVFGHSDNLPTSKDVLAALRRKPLSRDGGRGHEDFRRKHFVSRKVSTDDAVPDSTDQTSVSSSFLKMFGKNSASEDSSQKVLLLCGPPGLGKTTLAHIVANHCGYRVVEINASDDRVATSLQRKILDAVQMKSVSGDKRPNCLIIDEIDGAMAASEGRSALRHLIDLITPKKKTTGTVEHSIEHAAKKPAKKTRLAARETIARPIICICNDLYAPALRPLRQVARVHAFSKPSTSRIVSRLKYICEEEGCRTSIRTLTILAERTECDIRACLNTLQLLKRKGKHLTSLDDESLRIGYKDMTTNILEIWAEVYHRRKDPPSRLLIQEGRTAGGGGTQELLQFTRLYDLLASHGDHELAIEGLHENLLYVRYQDSNFSKTVGCLRSICDSDIRNKRVTSKQQFFLNAYQPASPISLRHLVAVPTKPKLQWPKAFQRYRTDLAIKTEMISSWINGMTPAISRVVSPFLLSVEMMTPLLAILSPPLRPVAVQLYTTTELQTMKQLIDTMVQYGLTYKEGEVNALKAGETFSTNQGQSEIQLDPPINSLASFEGYKMTHRPLSNTIRRLLGHQVEQEKLRREVIGVGKSIEKPAQDSHSPALKERNTNKSINGDEVKKPEAKLLHLFPENQNTEPESVSASAGSARNASLKIKSTPKVKNEISFFDRFSKGGPSAHQNSAQSSLTNQRDLRPLLYKFHEGFTNAIRRPFLIRELL